MPLFANVQLAGSPLSRHRTIDFAVHCCVTLFDLRCSAAFVVDTFVLLATKSSLTTRQVDGRTRPGQRWRTGTTHPAPSMSTLASNCAPLDDSGTPPFGHSKTQAPIPIWRSANMFANSSPYDIWCKYGKSFSFQWKKLWTSNRKDFIGNVVM